MAKEMNQKCSKALKVWRTEHSDPKTGKLLLDIIYKERREDLIEKLKQAQKRVDAIKEKINKIDNKQNKAKKAELLSKFTYEELLEKLSK